MLDLVSVIMSTTDPLQERTQRAVRHLQRSTVPYELILLNRNCEWTTGTIMNQGIAASVGSYIAVVCDDCFVEPDALYEMRLALQDPGVGVVGALLIYPDGRVQHAGGVVILGWDGDSNLESVGVRHIGQGEPMQAFEEADVQYVTGALMMTRRDVLERIGWYAEDCDLAFGDVDFCFRAREAAYRVKVMPSAKGVHLEGATRRTLEGIAERDARGVSWFLHRWEHNPSLKSMI